MLMRGDAKLGQGRSRDMKAVDGLHIPERSAGRNSDPAPAVRAARRHPVGLALIALGVVYGDIGTSPLYAFKQAAQAGGALSPATILGVLSLIFWALIVIVSAKYAILIMRADNHGEGGIVAMLALLNVRHAPAAKLACLPAGPRPDRRSTALWRRRDHAGHFRAQRHRGAQARRAATHAVRRAADACDPGRLLPGAASWDRGDRPGVRPGHAGVVRGDRRARDGRHRARSGRACGAQPVARDRATSSTLARRSVSPCSVPPSSRSQAGRPCMPTWGTSAGCRSGWAGSAWRCPASCSTTSARALCCSRIPPLSKTRSTCWPRVGRTTRWCSSRRSPRSSRRRRSSQARSP